MRVPVVTWTYRFARAGMCGLVLAATSLLLACGGGSSASDAGEGSSQRGRPAPIGAVAPAYRTVTLNGDSVVVGPSSEVLLLNVWATWCASCKEEFALLDRMLAEHGPSGLRVVAVSVDVGSVAPVLRVAEEYGVSFEIAHDPGGDVESFFPAMGVPASYLIDREGRLAWRHVGVLPENVDAAIRGALASAATSR